MEKDRVLQRGYFRNRLKVSRLCLFLWVVGFSGWGFCTDPSILYLTYRGDPTESITVQWHTSIEDQEGAQVFYRELDREEWVEAKGSVSNLESFKVAVHAVDLTQLSPGTEYWFRIGANRKKYKFRTLPSDPSQKIIFAVGGDAYRYLSLFRRMNAAVARKDPDFVVMGGDIAYTHGIFAFFKGKDWEMKRWRTFFEEWKKSLVTSDGRLIPIVPVLGNHDLRKTKKKPNAPIIEDHYHSLFYEFFALPQKEVSYRTLDIGSRFSFFLLDTNHSYPIEGTQSMWLEEALLQRESVPIKMAAYHVGAYPSVYPYTGQTPQTIRLLWSPLFEKYQLAVAFEHHNHAYKRTYPIREGQIDSKGVVYMGDGCWGVNARRTKKQWYLAERASKNSFCLVTLEEGGYSIEAIDSRGRQIDFWAPEKISPQEIRISEGS